jgi:hypothetical protein
MPIIKKQSIPFIQANLQKPFQQLFAPITLHIANLSFIPQHELIYAVGNLLTAKLPM